MSVYEMTVTTLSPLHIGDGNELRQDFDFLVNNGRTYRLNVDIILTAKSSSMIPDRSGQYPLPGKLLQEKDYKNPAFFRYVVPGFPRSRRADARLQSCIKDVYDRPYIPGSSLKGAIRTALAWTGWDEINPRLDRRALGHNRKWAGQSLEKKLFGRDPNNDLLRALQVGDCSGLQKAGERILVTNAQVLTRKSAGSPVELESIAPNTSFHGTLHIDEVLFSPEFDKKLHFKNRKHWLDELIPRIQKHSLARIEELSAWFEKTEGCEKIAGFYRQLIDSPLSEH